MFAGAFAESDIEVDYCRSCEGLWFDAKELKKTIQYLESYQPSPVAPKIDSDVRRNTKSRGSRNGLGHRIAMSLSKTYRAVHNADAAEFPNQFEGYRMFRGRVVLSKKSLTSPVSKTRCACYREIRAETYFVDMSYTTSSTNDDGGTDTRRVERPDKRVREVTSDQWRYSNCVVECEFSRFEVATGQALLRVSSTEKKGVERDDSDRYATTETIEQVFLKDGDEVFVYGLVAGGKQIVPGGKDLPLIVTDRRRKKFLEEERQQVVPQAVKGALSFCLITMLLLAVALWHFLSR